MANAVPKIPPVTTSGGIDAPTENEPIKANSKVAPIIIPVFTSPKTIPVNNPVTIGRESREVPNAYSDCAIKATRPKRIACRIIFYSSFLIRLPLLLFFYLLVLDEFLLLSHQRSFVPTIFLLQVIR